MSLSPAAVLDLAERCAPAVAAQTLSAVALAESGFEPLAIHVNRGGRNVPRPAAHADALAAARSLKAAGADFDLGLLQINVRNLRRLGLSLEDAFDPCRSLAAGAALLAADYRAVRAEGPGPQLALRTALSRYNTGDPGSITTIHADSALLAFEQLTLLVKESEGGRDLPRAEIRALLHVLVDVVVQMRRIDGRFSVSEIYYDPLRKRALAA